MKFFTMNKIQKNTSSFMLRFSQNVYEGEETEIQWRGHISHVQSGDEIKFSEVNDALLFIQNKLKDMTLDATSDKSEQEQEGLLQKSFYIWNKLALGGPKFVVDTIKNPKKQVAEIQNQLSNIGEEIGNRVTNVEWRPSNLSDIMRLEESIKALTNQLEKLDKKVDKIAKSKK